MFPPAVHLAARYRRRRSLERLRRAGAATHTESRSSAALLLGGRRNNDIILAKVRATRTHLTPAGAEGRQPAAEAAKSKCLCVTKQQTDMSRQIDDYEYMRICLPPFCAGSRKLSLGVAVVVAAAHELVCLWTRMEERRSAADTQPGSDRLISCLNRLACTRDRRVRIIIIADVSRLCVCVPWAVA